MWKGSEGIRRPKLTFLLGFSRKVANEMSTWGAFT